ncbi:hypothetical protein D9B38_05485 [Corynebacterium diphtheriae]|uniref:phage tail tube protein n=1 Tax=Corynebacterium diphtheriae TaxID=1717 RepID=UPI000EB58D8B|nr:hypothetical protein [Corynebacterium diphtheriae]RKW91745.1 hypothetical protein D9B38_05485 [Corynebacterium diphtheriae]CAB0543151.1 hypothetical protein CIP107521_00717 [Corynebacterium diphtheriae]
MSSKAEVAKAPGSCELNKMLNREWAVQIKRPGEGAEAWKFVRGMNSVSVNMETSTVDSSDIDSDGWESVEKTSRKLIVELKGAFARVGKATTIEPSHKLLRDTGKALGFEGKLDVRVWRTDGDDEAYELTATNEFSTESGESNALRNFSAKLQSSCAPREIKPVLKGAETKESVYVDADSAGDHSSVASQKIIVPNDVSGGTFTLTDGNKISGALGYNVAAREVQAEIRKFDGASGATVTGSSALGYTVKNAPKLTSNSTDLTGGSENKVTIV